MKILAPIFLLFLFGCTNLHKEQIPYVKYVTVQYQEISNSKIFYGYIDRGLDVDLSFGMSGIMNEIFVSEGDFVKKGKLLAKLDNEEYTLAIARAKTELDDATVKYNRAKSYYERISKLHTAGGISYNDWEAAQTDLKSAKNQIDIAQDTLNTAKNKETFSNIYAPDDGYIIKTYKDKMQFATVGEKVILFQGSGMPEARVFASQNDINGLYSRQKVILYADAFKNKKYPAFIKTKTLTSINEGTYRVTVSILNNPIELLDGMSVYIQIADQNKKIMLIPLQAVFAEENGKYVYVAKDFTAVKTKVETGEILNDKIEIKNGISPGQKIIIQGGNKIMDGAKILYD